jgi:hypothetical protein
MPIPFAAMPSSFIAWTDADNNNNNKKCQQRKLKNCANIIFFHTNLGELKVDVRALGYELLEGSDEKHGPMVSQHSHLRALQQQVQNKEKRFHLPLIVIVWAVNVF